MTVSGGLTDIDGIKVGVASNFEAATGVSVVLVENGAKASVEVRGSAPGTRETDLLRPGRLVEEIQAVVLTGGSAFGLDAASGVVRYLEEINCGFPVERLKVPIVPAAVLFDLFVGSESVRPDAEMGYRAALAASSESVPEGSVGAGTGAAVGKILGISRAVKAGQGSASVRREELVTAALVVCNAFGDVFDRQGKLLAGPRSLETGLMEKTADLLLGKNAEGFPAGNTTLAVVATNAALDKNALKKVCQLSHDGLARSIWPVHTMWDGDTIFALSKGDLAADVNLVGLMAAEAVCEAVRRAVLTAESRGGLPSLHELKNL